MTKTGGSDFVQVLPFCKFKKFVFSRSSRFDQQIYQHMGWSIVARFQSRSPKEDALARNVFVEEGAMK